MVAFSVVFFFAFVYVVARGALDWGPLQRIRPVRTDGAVSAERTATTTVRRVGLEGRSQDEAADGLLKDIRDHGLEGIDHNILTGKLE